MALRIGIRREDMYAWEKRTPLIPDDARTLQNTHGLEIVAQSTPKRIFTDEDYRRAGIPVAVDLSACSIIVGIKEIPLSVFEEGKVYLFFSHTIKGQPYNMPMLKRMLELGCTLIDYEKVADDNGRRLIFFGNYAGLAGMIEALWALGRRLAWEGIEIPFQGIKRALDYPDLETAKETIRRTGKRIVAEGLSENMSPFVIGIAGYGNVSRGAQEILDLLPVETITPEELSSLVREEAASRHVVYKVVFKEEDMVERIGAEQPFNLQEYYDHPKRYRGVFERYLPYLTVLLNCIYWEPIYPRLVTKETVKEMYRGSQPRLRVIGDISCDVEGAIECTIRATEPDNPVYVYDPMTDRVIDGVKGSGPVILAVEILPSELPREASIYFSGVLKDYLPAVAGADFSGKFEACNLPPPLKRAVIVYRGELAPDYRYLEQFLDRNLEEEGEAT
jgi:alanine dehydrogenase